MTIEEKYKQYANSDYIRNRYGKEQWIQISGQADINESSGGYWCALASLDIIENVFMRNDWDVQRGSGGPGFEGSAENCEYCQNLLDEGFEQLLFYREFYGVRKNYVELSQEFILLNNLYYDSDSRKYYAMYTDGRSEEVVRFSGEDDVFIKLSFLSRYAAAKQMAVVLYFDIKTYIKGGLIDNGLVRYNDSYKSKDCYYEIWGDEMSMSTGIETYSVLMGKKILYPQEINTCGYWPFEKEEEYVDFIIGIDEFGNEKSFTCNPDKLANYFGANPNAPHYLTPVFFKREVLQKYIAHPELYKVVDGKLECKSLWAVELDNHHKDYVAVYLGDLGRDLPEAERLYWKSFNIICDEKISDVSFKRDFMCIPAESNMSEHIIKLKYKLLNVHWEENYGWLLFIPLSEGDKYNLELLRIPLTESQEEFDGLVLSLVKVLIDSLNEKKLQESLEKVENEKGISKLNRWLSANSFKDYDSHIAFLRDLQDLRSKGTGHRKGDGYEKTAIKFGIGTNTNREVFESILNRAIEFLDYLDSKFE